MSPYSLLAVPMVVLGAIGWWGLKNLSREICRSDHSKWSELGDPFKYSAYSILKELRWSKFIFLREYKGLENRRISSLGNLILACSLTNIGLAVLWGILES